MCTHRENPRREASTETRHSDTLISTSSLQTEANAFQLVEPSACGVLLCSLSRWIQVSGAALSSPQFPVRTGPASPDHSRNPGTLCCPCTLLSPVLATPQPGLCAFVPHGRGDLCSSLTKARAAPHSSPSLNTL